MCASSASSNSGNAAIGAVIGVSITPGAIALTRTPSGAQVFARFVVSVTIPAFAEPYPGTIDWERNADIDAMLTTLAPPGRSLAEQEPTTSDREAHRSDEVDGHGVGETLRAPTRR